MSHLTSLILLSFISFFASSFLFSNFLIDCNLSWNYTNSNCSSFNTEIIPNVQKLQPHVKHENVCLGLSNVHNRTFFMRRATYTS